ncbi:MAG: 3-deoxy-manno-octulosonate cytidylyltransferase [bacterium]
MKKKVIAIIPARMASTRYPGKPIVDICGMSMIEHVWRRVRLNNKISEVYVATCDKEIKIVAEAFGAKVIMTSDKHVRCTDRVTEACKKLLVQQNDFEIVINVQGDEPLLNPVALDLTIDPFMLDPNIAVVNLIEELIGKENINNVNNVKAVIDQRGYALYFSRFPVPNGDETKHYKQLGIYGLTKETILKYEKMEITPLEIAESCDMLRFIENGIPIYAPLSPYITKGIDTPADHEKVNEIMAQDKLFKQYHDHGGTE